MGIFTSAHPASNPRAQGSDPTVFGNEKEIKGQIVYAQKHFQRHAFPTEALIYNYLKETCDLFSQVFSKYLEHCCLKVQLDIKTINGGSIPGADSFKGG